MLPGRVTRRSETIPLAWITRMPEKRILPYTPEVGTWGECTGLALD
jgi:hypothetical protein